MAHLIEIKILDEILISGCDTNTTVTELSLEAMKEYEKAYKFDTPKTIQSVRDRHGRILSGNLQIVQLNLDKYLEIIVIDEENSSNIPKIVNPKDVYEKYEKWQIYVARQMNGYCQNLIPGELPTKESLLLLDDLKNSVHIPVQTLNFSSYETLLTKLRNEIIFSQILDSLYFLLLNTKSSTVMISSLTLLFQVKLSSTYGHHVNLTQLMNDVNKLMKQFPDHEIEILNLCEQYGNTIPYFSTTIMKNGNDTKHGTHNQSPTRTRTLGDELRRPTSSSAAADSSNSNSSSNGMSFERIIELLSSADARCKEFALEKLEKKESTGVTVGGGGGGGASDHQRKMSRENGKEMNYLSQVVFVNKISDSYQLLRVLFDCLKSSLRPPTQQPTPTQAASTTGAGAGAGGGGGGGGSSSSIQQPLTCLVIESALCSEQTSLPLVTSSLRCIHHLIQLIQQRGDEWTSSLTMITPTHPFNPSNTLEHILSDKIRLLLTLSHANHLKYPQLIDQSADLLVMFFRICGWEKYRIKLDFNSLIFFLNADIPLSRTYLGLDYLVYCVESSHTSKEKESLSSDPINSPTLPRRRNGGGGGGGSSSSGHEATTSSSLNALFCDDNYLILRLLWRWIVGNYGLELTLKSLQSFSSASVLISVKTFLIKFQIYEKVLSVFSLTPHLFPPFLSLSL
jgi:hypothetical protein